MINATGPAYGEPQPAHVTTNQHQVVEVNRPNYGPTYTNNVGPVKKEPACPPVLCGILVALAVIALILAILTGLGVFGPNGTSVEDNVANNYSAQPVAAQSTTVQPVAANTQPVTVQPATVAAHAAALLTRHAMHLQRAAPF